MAMVTVFKCSCNASTSASVLPDFTFRLCSPKTNLSKGDINCSNISLSLRLHRQATRRSCFRVVASSAQTTSLSEAESVPLTGDLTTSIPASAGVYAVYDSAGNLQFIGLSRRISASLSSHVKELPELCASAKFAVINAPERAALVEAWKQWMEEHISLTGKLPPGNEKGVTTWTERKAKPAKRDLWLTPGPNVELNMPLEQLIDIVVKEHKVVIFIKGSRNAPQCGFSHKVLTILNEHEIEYESLNVLDKEHNRGLREKLKVYSQWPTIPQIFVNGEFIGGSDILEELATDGKIKEVFHKST